MFLPLSLSLPFYQSIYLLVFLPWLFFSILDCTTRMARVVTPGEVEVGPRRLNMCLRLGVPERPYNRDTCQNNWHTGVSNLPRSRWRTSTSKESWSCVTASRPLSMNFRRPSGRRRIINRPGLAIKDAHLHSTNVSFIKSIVLVCLFHTSAFVTRK